MKTFNEITQMAEKSDVLLTVFDGEKFQHYRVFYHYCFDSQGKILLIQSMESIFCQKLRQKKLKAKDGKKFPYPSYSLKIASNETPLDCFTEKRYNQYFIENLPVKHNDFLVTELIDYNDYFHSVEKSFKEKIEKLNEEALNNVKKEIADYEVWLDQNPLAIDAPEINAGSRHSHYGKIGNLDDFLQWYSRTMWSAEMSDWLATTKKEEESCQNYSIKIINYFGWTKEQVIEAGEKFLDQIKNDDDKDIFSLMIKKLIDFLA